MAHLNPQISSAAHADDAESTYHPLSGHAQQILLVTTAATGDFWFTFDSTGDMLALSTAMCFCPGNYPLLLAVNYPSYINILSSGTSFLVYITEFY